MKANLNKSIFLQGMRTAKDKIYRVLMARLAKYGEYLLEDAQFRAEYTSFTGNTLTSLAFGVYENSQLTDVVFINGLQPAVHAKVQKGQTVYLSNPYDGAPRSVTGKVDVTDDYGIDTSVRVLEGLMPKGGNGIVVTTGTEYSDYLESVYNLNVLSDTYLEASNIAWNRINSTIDPNTPIDKL